MAEDMNQKRFDIAEVVVLSGWSLTIVACLAIIGAAVASALLHQGEVSGPMKDWAGMCLGFLLGNFVNLVKDFIKTS